MKIKKLKLTEYLLYAAIILAGIALDILTKELIIAHLYRDSIPLIDGVLHLTYSENTGCAFGMLKTSRWVFLSVSGVMIVALIAYLALGLADNRLYGIGAALITSGGIGNMIERIGKGYVVDFIDFRLINFAIFNGADSLVCIGAGLLILALILDIIKEGKAAKADGTPPEN